jgi:hypothetical protein
LTLSPPKLVALEGSDVPTTREEAEKVEQWADRENLFVTYHCPHCSRLVVSSKDNHFDKCRAYGGGSPSNRVDSKDLEVDAAARLGAKSKRLRCPRCNENYLAGKGHLGSDYCLVRSTVAEQARQGFVRCSTWAWTRKTLPQAGVEMRELPGALNYQRGRYRGVEAKNSVFVPRWTLRVLRSCYGVSNERKVALLRALQMPVLSQVLDFVTNSRHVPHELLELATDDEYETADLLTEAYNKIATANNGD